MIKRIKKWGDSLVIRFSPEDAENYGLMEGDLIDLSDSFQLKQIPTNKIKVKFKDKETIDFHELNKKMEEKENGN